MAVVVWRPTTAAIAAIGTLALGALGAIGSIATGGEDVEAASSANAVASWCRPGTTLDDLNRMFDGDPGGIVGADYPRSLALPDGRVLWTFQDPLVRSSSGAIRNLHNAAVVQDGSCFEFLRTGSAANPRPWLLPELTVDERDWFWPLDMVVSADESTIYVFLAQMFEVSGEAYLTTAVPNSVVVMTLDATTLAPTGGPFTPSWGLLTPSDPTLYGFSAAAAGNWIHLFGHCHRQFGFDPFFNDTFIHDSSCTKRVPLARVPHDDVFAPAQYWTGSRWSSDRNAARSLLDTSRANVTHPTQFEYVNGRWMAVTKLDDWFGQWIVVDQADKVTGPWEQTAWIRATPKCPRTETDPGCNTYFSSFVADPTRTVTDPVVISLSNNLWTGVPSSLYRPTYLSIEPPTGRAALADRCLLDQC